MLLSTRPLKVKVVMPLSCRCRAIRHVSNVLCKRATTLSGVANVSQPFRTRVSSLRLSCSLIFQLYRDKKTLLRPMPCTSMISIIHRIPPCYFNMGIQFQWHRGPEFTSRGWRKSNFFFPTVSSSMPRILHAIVHNLMAQRAIRSTKKTVGATNVLSRCGLELNVRSIVGNSPLEQIFVLSVIRPIKPRNAQIRDRQSLLKTSLKPIDWRADCGEGDGNGHRSQ